MRQNYNFFENEQNVFGNYFIILVILTKLRNMEHRLNTQLIVALNDVLHRPVEELRETTSIPNATWYRIMHHPEAITVQQLLTIANALHVPVRRFFYTGKTFFIGQRDDYVTEPYLPCSYEHIALQRLVSKKTDTTWKRAAQATGMSYSRLRNSLLAITRTPVERFLIVCDTFGIDPFEILVDPNPLHNPKPNRNKASVPTPPFNKDISDMRRDIVELRQMVADLKGKYEALMKAHEQLAKRIQVNIGTISGSNISTIGIAADPVISPSDDD